MPDFRFKWLCVVCARQKVFHIDQKFPPPPPALAPGIIESKMTSVGTLYLISAPRRKSPLIICLFLPPLSVIDNIVPMGISASAAAATNQPTAHTNNDWQQLLPPSTSVDAINNKANEPHLEPEELREL